MELWPARGRKRVILSNPFANVGGIVQFRSNPVSVVFLGSLVRRSAAAEWVKYDVSWFGRNKDSAFGDDEFQFVDPGTNLKLAVAVWRRVSPEVGQINTLGVHLVSMSSVILDFSPAMPASFNR